MLLLVLLFQAPAIGLVNLGGGSCFLNVVLQCLAHMQPLRDFYLHYGTATTLSQHTVSMRFQAYLLGLELAKT